MDTDLDSLYTETQSALKAKDYERASELLRQILIQDENYRDASRLLAQTIKLRRRRWYNHPLLWSGLVLAIVVGLGFFIAPRVKEVRTVQPSATSNIAPSTVALPTKLPSTVTATVLPTPTSIPFAWQRVAIGQEFERDIVTALVIDPKDPEVLYAGMKNAGIFKSIDGGLSWRPAHHGLANAHIMSLLIDFQDSRILYASTVSETYKTDDSGENWHKFAEENFLLMDPQDSSHLYKRDSDMIYETTNRGESWETVYTSQDDCLGKILGWGIHPVDGNTLFASGGEACEPGLYTSKDGGRNWALLVKDNDVEMLMERITVGIDRQGNLYYHWTGWGVEPIKNGTGRSGVFFPYPLPETITFDITGLVYFSCPPDKLCKFNLDDNQKMSLGKPEVGIVTSIAISPVDPSIIYIGGEGISVSKDGGLKWSKLNNGLGNAKLSLEPGLGDSETLYLLSGDCHEVRTPQFGSKSWENEIVQPLYRSTNGGGTWDFSTQVGCNLVKDADGLTLYRVSQEVDWYNNGQLGMYWILRSRDEGKSWGTTFSTANYTTITADVAHSGFLYSYGNLAGDPSRGIIYDQYISGDYGHKWRAKDPPADVKICYGSTLQFIDAYRPMTIDPQDGNHVFVIDNGALLESYDSCETTSAFETIPTASMNSIAFDTRKPGTLYAGTDEGAFISFDAGGTWHQINDGLLGATAVYSIAVDNDGNVYAATPYGIFRLEGK